jgi:hypothetical protein
MTPDPISPPAQRPQDRIEHHLQLPADIFRKEPQHQIAVLLQQTILPPVATIRNGVAEMLAAIELHGHSRVRAAVRCDARGPLHRR